METSNTTNISIPKERETKLTRLNNQGDNLETAVIALERLLSDLRVPAPETESNKALQNCPHSNTLGEMLRDYPNFFEHITTRINEVVGELRDELINA